MLPGAMILVGAGLLFGGFYALIYTFRYSSRYGADAGAMQIGISSLAIGCGGVSVIFGLASVY